MNNEQLIENRLAELERKLLELEIQNDTLDRESAELLAQAQVSEKQLSAFISNSSHFTEDNWETLLAEKKKVDDKLARELENISSPAKSRKKRQDLHVPNHWLFVR